MPSRDCHSALCPGAHHSKPMPPAHGCGQNLMTAGSFAAAVTLKELIAERRLRGTGKCFGTPAEESIGGKLYMIRDGAFDGVDVVLAWHPAASLTADTRVTQAMVDLSIEFRRRTAHAALDPWNGRSGLDALEVFTMAPTGVPWHSWYVTAAGGMSIGHKGMLHAAKALGMTAVDLYQEPALLKTIQEDFDAVTSGRKLAPLIPPGPPPVARASRAR